MDQIINIILLIFILLLFIVFIITCIKLINISDKKNEGLRGENFNVLIDILKGIIAIEIDLYETNIFKDREGITNANFDNYYNDMCMNIEKNISEDFMKEITKYVTEDFVYTLIARKIKVYLASKVV